MNQREFYSTGLSNLGLVSLLRYELLKRFSHNKRLKYTSKKLKFPVFARPNTSDCQVFAQILFYEEYRCLADLKTPKFIVDLGANVGYSAAYFLSRFPDCSVLAVEPDPGNFQQLCENVAPYGSRAKTLQAAAWSRSELLQLDTAFGKAGDEWGARVKPAAENSSETVPAVTIPDLLSTSGFDRISLLKVDIEGAETAIFRSGAREWLDKVDNIVIELHGDEASRAFFAAIDASRFTITTCDELTVCLAQ
jgi:FkbM family methyltransferase